MTMTSTGWTLGASVVDFNDTKQWWKVAGASEPTTVTIGLSASDSCEVVLLEYSGLVTPTPIDKTATATSGTAVCASGTTATLAQSDELAIAVFGRQGTGLTATYTNSFVSEGSQTGSGGVPTSINVASLATASTAAVSTTATLSSGSGDIYS